MPKIIGQVTAWWDSLSHLEQMDFQRKYYHTGSDDINITFDMIKMMYEAEHRKAQSNLSLEWWRKLDNNTQNYFKEKYSLKIMGSYDEENILSDINFVYQNETKQSPTITNNSDKLSFIAQMKDIPLEERYDYAAAVLLTCPISIDELSEMFLLLQKSLRLYKERSKKL